MSTKASTVVVIDKKEYNLSGFEQEDYLQMVAAYINQKITEMNQQESYKRIPQDMKNLMLQLNLADDYFKAKEQAEISGGKFSDLEKEIFELKHKLVEVQMKADDNASKVELLKAQNSDFQTQIEKLEKEKRELLAGKQQLQAALEGIAFGKPDSVGDKLKPVLSNANIFGTDLYAAGIGEQIEALVREELAGPGAIRATLKAHV